MHQIGKQDLQKFDTDLIEWGDADRTRHNRVQNIVDASRRDLRSQFTRVGVHVRNLRQTRMTATTYNQHVRLLSSEPVGWLSTTKLYSDTGADIVMQSISLKTPARWHFE